MTNFDDSVIKKNPIIKKTFSMVKTKSPLSFKKNNSFLI